MSFAPEVSYDPLTKIWSCQGESDHFAPDLSIGQIIYQEMRRHPKLIAQISDTENTILTREELLLNSMRVASYMRNLGLLQTDIVGIIARNTTHLSAVAYGCFFNGIAFHAVSVFHEQNTIGKLFNITKPRIIFCDGDEYEKVLEATRDLEVKIITMRNHSASSINIEDVLKTLVEKNFKPARLEQGINQTLAILCTSGTTGLPKASAYSNSRKLLSGSLKLTTSDVQYALRPLDWTAGLIVTVTSGVFSTIRIITDRPYESKELLHLIEKYKVTWLLVLPPSLALMVSCPEFETANLDSLRYVIYTGDRCSWDAQHRLRSCLQRNILHFAYGLVEVGIWATFNWHFDEKPNSVGRLTTGFKLKIVNNLNETLGPNTVGEIWLNNGQHWAGYYGNLEESSRMRDQQDWYHTGDLGYVDSDGFLYIVGREKDLLRSHYADYFPSEIEAVVLKMPQVSDVCVFGVWNKFKGDEAVAAVVTKPGFKLDENDVVDFVKDHLVEKHKHLNGGVLVVEDLKRSPNGKINRAANKAHFMELKGLREF